MSDACPATYQWMAETIPCSLDAGHEDDWHTGSVDAAFAVEWRDDVFGAKAKEAS